MKTQLTRQIHNPDNLTPEQYGAKDGWRLLYSGESRRDCEYLCEYLDRFRSSEWREWTGIDEPIHTACEFSYRTKRPDPFADGWIKMSDRQPTATDLPVWYFDERSNAHGFSGVNGPWGAVFTGYTHWKPAKNDIPAPPVVELTQEEKDEAALVQYEKQQWPDSLSVSHRPRQMWHAALAYERARVKGTQ